MLKETQKDAKEAEILSEIKDSEKKADDIINRARIEIESILQEASMNSSILLSKKQEETAKAKEKRIADFREKLRFIKEEKLDEGNSVAKQLKSEAQKKIPNAIEIVMQKFEEMI